MGGSTLNLLKFLWFKINWGPHTGLLYSSVGRSIVTNNFANIFGSKYSKDLLVSLSRRFALVVTSMVRSWNFRWLSNIILRSLWDTTLAITVPLKRTITVSVPKCKYLHFTMLKFNCQWSDHSWNKFKLFWRIEWSSSLCI